MFLHSLDPKATFGIDRLTLRPDVISLSYTRVWEETGSMVADRVQRRLAAILAADVVGYSRLMDVDEDRLMRFRIGVNLGDVMVEGYRERCAALREFIYQGPAQGNRFLVTCRILDYGEEFSGLQRVEVQSLSDDRFKFFLRNELLESWQTLWQMLLSDESRHRLMELARNPYLLTVMIDVFEEDGEIYALGTLTTAVSFAGIFISPAVVPILQRRRARHGSDAGAGMV